MSWFEPDRARYRDLATAWVVPAPRRCVQCGICSFNCPMGLDVRGHVWRDDPVRDSHCLTCGQCIEHCPRGLLRFERIPAAAAPRVAACDGDRAGDPSPPRTAGAGMSGG